MNDDLKEKDLLKETAKQLDTQPKNVHNTLKNLKDKINHLDKRIKRWEARDNMKTEKQWDETVKMKRALSEIQNNNCKDHSTYWKISFGQTKICSRCLKQIIEEKRWFKC